MIPVNELFKEVSQLDFAVLGHGFAPHGRDYFFAIQDSVGPKPGTFKLIFTHCVQLDYETRVRNDVWPISWSDEFLDYKKWEEAGSPEGYVWGTNWSLAYPGISIIENSTTAKKFKDSIGKSFSEVTIETDRFFIRMIFHGIEIQKIDESIDTVSKVVIPIQNK